MIWYILIALFVLLITWILLGPVIMRIDTDRNQYMFSLPGVVTAGIVHEEEHIYIRGWIFFIPVKIDPFKQRRKRKKRTKEVSKKKKSRKSRRRMARMFRKMTRAIRIKRLELDLDTDDFPLNAQLVPLFALISNQRNIQMQVNFEGNLFLHLDVRTRIGAILWLMLTRR